MVNLSMMTKRRTMTVVVVLFLAFLTGHMMQTVLTDRAPVVSATLAPDAETVGGSLLAPKPLALPPDMTLMPTLDQPPVLPRRTEETQTDQLDEANADCVPKLLATTAPAAMITLVLRAPCHPNLLVQIKQGPIIASAYTDGDGRMTLKIPALETVSDIQITFDDVVLATELTIPEAENFQHIILNWTGPQLLRLNAYEFGAARNETGHVWSGAPKSPTRASRGSGGFLTRLVTEKGPSVEIYSLPAGQSQLRGVVRLVVEAAVTPATCGQIATAKALQPTAFRRLSVTDVEVALPDCDHQGKVVLLQNLLRDVTLAAR
ncbi:hypothetical protein N9L47_07895 [Rhodobacteraceae bacterium]|nr:hypothetical protein [Paracoccaceae bacterium]